MDSSGWKRIIEYRSKSGNLDHDPHCSEKQTLDPDPHQSEKMEALEGHLEALEDPNLEKSAW